MKKKSAKDKPSGKRTLKDLPPRKTQDVKGGWGVPGVDLSANSAPAPPSPLPIPYPNRA